MTKPPFDINSLNITYSNSASVTLQFDSQSATAGYIAPPTVFEPVPDPLSDICR